MPKDLQKEKFRQQRVVIENINPQIQCGSYYIKRVVGEEVTVWADILPDGHDIIQAEVLYRHENEKNFRAVRMTALGNDVFNATFLLDNQGFYEYKIQAWVDHALNWQHGLQAKLEAGQQVRSELLDGIQYLEFLKGELPARENDKLAGWISVFGTEKDYEAAIKVAASEKLHKLFLNNPQRRLPSVSKVLQVYVDRKKANFSTWYEFFPRSASPERGKHGTFADCERLLPRIAKMGFDTIYFPPVHPIGEVNRKGKNNTTDAKEGDTGVPWGIGSRHGGHKAIHPELGTEQDFKKLIKKAAGFDLEIAMDLAFQAAPDHPYVSEHPQWFRKRPDGTIPSIPRPITGGRFRSPRHPR
jgi:starch synthase (maltosyl-transferring)